MMKNILRICAAAVCLGALLALCGCASKSNSDSSLINQQGDQASIAPIDKAKTAAAATELQVNPDLAHFHLEVKVFNTTATITGTVDTDAEKAEAEKVVKSVDGVDNVQNNVTVSPPSSP